MGTWGYLYNSVMGSFWEHQNIFQAFLCLSVHPFALQFITQPVALHHCGSLLYWTGCLWMYAMLHAVDLFCPCSASFMSQASTTTSMTTTHVTVVCSNTPSCLSAVTMAPSLMRLPAKSGQHNVVLPSLLTPKNSRGVVGLATVPQQQPQSQMPLQAYANYAMGPPQVGFSFRTEMPTFFVFYMFGVCYG